VRRTLLFSLAALLILACGQKPAPVGGVKPKVAGPVLARVGDEELTRDQLLILFRGQIPPDPPKDKLEGVLESWANGELWTQEALRQGIGRDETTLLAVRNDERNLFARLLLSRIQDTITVTDAEIYDYYAKHKNDYAVSTSIMYMQLYDSLLAERIARKLKDGADFAATAREFSPEQVTFGAPTRYFVRSDTEMLLLTISPELNEEIFSLPKGASSRVVHTTVGARSMFWIIKCVDRRQVKTDVKFDDVREVITKELMPWKQQQVMESITEQLKKRTKFELKPENFYGPGSRR
jgi:hypothetical protein